MTEERLWPRISPNRDDGRNIIMSAIIIIPCYTVKLDNMLGDDICQGVLQTPYKHVAGLFEEHVSGTTNTIYMLFKNCVTWKEKFNNIHVLFENDVTYDE